MQSNFLGDGQETTDQSRGRIHTEVAVPMADSNKASNLTANCTSTEAEAKCSQKSKGAVGCFIH